MSAYERQLVARNAEHRSQKGEWQGRKGSPLRELHICVFDVMVQGRGRGGTVFVGSGARAYDMVGKRVPSGVVGWMMGLRNKDTGRNLQEVEKET